MIAQVSSSWLSDSNSTKSFEVTDRQSPPAAVDGQLSKRDSILDMEFVDLVWGFLGEDFEGIGAGASTSPVLASHDTNTTASTAGPVVLQHDSDTTYPANVPQQTNTAWAGYEGHFPAMPITSTATFERQAETETAPCTESSVYESIRRTLRAEAMGGAVGDMSASGECAHFSICFSNDILRPRLRFAIP